MRTAGISLMFIAELRGKGMMEGYGDKEKLAGCT
jgi:hypothetical protein